MGSLDHNGMVAIPLDRPGWKRNSADFLENAAAVLIGIFVFFNPFPHTTAIKEIAFYSSLFIVLILALFMKRDFRSKDAFYVAIPVVSFLGDHRYFFHVRPVQYDSRHFSHYIKYLFPLLHSVQFLPIRKNVYSCLDHHHFGSLFSIGGLTLFLWYPKPPSLRSFRFH